MQFLLNTTQKNKENEKNEYDTKHAQKYTLWTL